RRKSEEWIAGRLNDPGSRFVPIWNAKVLVDGSAAPRPIFLTRSQVEPMISEGREPLFLGEEGGQGYFALELDGAEPDAVPGASGRFQDLRAVAPVLAREDGALLAYAKTLVYWHGRNRYCGSCGSLTRIHEGGDARKCTSSACGLLDFPRTDPAVIVLIRSGQRCLLGRQASWIDRMYSVIAGFVGPGECAEAAVVREVFEETGVRVKNIRYQSSQPWPFPCSLMLGFSADAENEDICLGDKELEDARWVSRRELADAVGAGTMRLPSKVSIAYHLIEDWFEAEPPFRLSDLARKVRVA
ncbi:MAG: NAD(+) diphosphatase, partial [Desulfobacteraceae bacterium]|nr:NAD(+) diphosphatase [Desulfobacteraceae bacterium]